MGLPLELAGAGPAGPLLFTLVCVGLAGIVLALALSGGRLEQRSAEEMARRLTAGDEVGARAVVAALPAVLRSRVGCAAALLLAHEANDAPSVAETRRLRETGSATPTSPPATSVTAGPPVS